MRHQVKKIKIKRGKDATRSVIKKLLFNFVKNNRIETTLKKAKILKNLLDRLVTRAKKNDQAVKNILLKFLPDKKAREKLIKVAKSEFNDRLSGFVKLTRTRYRLSDGSQMAKIEWIKPVIELQEKEKKEKKKTVVKNDNNIKKRK